MAYSRNTWVDQSVERPRTYEMTNNADGSVTLIDSFGLVSELGTPVDADHMNHIEEGIELVDISVGDLNNLETGEKTNLVAAINELKENNLGNESKLEAQKAYITGNVLTDEKGYSELEELAHSTFDLSKFEVVGSPIITDDGIVRFTSSSQRVIYPLNKTITSYNKLIIKGGFIFHPKTSTTVEMFYSFGQTRAEMQTNRLLSFFHGSNIINPSESNIVFDNNLNDGDIVDYIYTQDIIEGTFKIEAYVNGVFVKSVNGSFDTQSFSTSISSFNTNNMSYTPIDLEIDLKKYRVIIDNEVVINGNQTGLDVLKPDDYTVVGSPTISDDGVLSNASNVNFVQKQLTNIITDNEVKTIFPIYISSEIPLESFCNIIILQNSTSSILSQVINVSGNNYCRVRLSNGSVDIWSSPRAKSLSLNTLYIAESIINIEEQTNKLNIYSNGELYDSSSITLTTDLGEWQGLSLVNIANSSTNYVDIDLNLIKVFGNGLVYQPCLKIPYTLSKTGSKIVDVSARERVIDAYNQGFKEIYYTIDETNQNYTIPMGEVYGMIENAKRSSRNIGEIITSTIPLNDEGLHLADGSLLQQSGVYGDFVEYMASLVSTYPNLFTTESAWQALVQTYGVCGYYVYDATNKTLRLPKIEGFIEGTNTITNVGNIKGAGLPNITGNIGTIGIGGTIDGAFSNTGSAGIIYNSQGENDYQVDFDASRSSSIYGNSDTVQPQSIKVLYYIVLANGSRNTVNVAPENIITEVNGKADIDLSNCTKPYIKQSQATPSSHGYILYSNGNFEEWGSVLSASAAQTTVTLSRNMATNSYNISITPNADADLSNSMVVVGIPTEASFTVDNIAAGNSFFWRVIGKLEEGEF